MVECPGQRQGRAWRAENRLEKRISVFAHLIAGGCATVKSDVCEDDGTEDQERRGPLPAPGPQRVGPGRRPVGSEAALRVRARGPARPGRGQAAGRVPDPTTRPDRCAERDRRWELAFCESRAFGGTFTLDALWRQLGIDTVLKGLEGGRGRARRGRPREVEVTERVLFGLIANRALAPSSKLAAADWINHDVHIDGLPETSDDACYRAMDWLHDVREHLEAGVFHQVANLLNLEVDLLFFDTTSTYFELEDADEPVARDTHGHVLPDTDTDTDTTARRRRRAGRHGGPDGVGFRTYGKSKDSRDDLPRS